MNFFSFCCLVLFRWNNALSDSHDSTIGLSSALRSTITLAFCSANCIASAVVFFRCATISVLIISIAELFKICDHCSLISSLLCPVSGFFSVCKRIPGGGTLASAYLCKKCPCRVLSMNLFCSLSIRYAFLRIAVLNCLMSQFVLGPGLDAISPDVRSSRVMTLQRLKLSVLP